MCKNNMCEKVFNSENMEIDLSKNIDEIISSYLENDKEELLRECIHCENTDFIKVSCFECEVFICFFCYDELKNNMELWDYDIVYNEYENKYVCNCKVGFCGDCNEYRNNDMVIDCNNCDRGFCCGYVEWKGDNYCRDCMNIFRIEDFEDLDCCNECGENCNELMINDINIYTDNVNLYCEDCI